MFRTAITTRASAFTASRAFHSTPRAAKSVTEKVSEVAQDVNMKVGKTLAAGIEKGEKATEATKSTIGLKTEEAKEKTEEGAAKAGAKANLAAAGAKEAKEDFKKEVKK